MSLPASNIIALAGKDLDISLWLFVNINFSELYGPGLSNTQSRIMLPQTVNQGMNRRSG